MKTLILGDIHGRTVWEKIVEHENPDRTIFLGDYVSTHDGISEDQQIENLSRILDFYEENEMSVVLLRGNHDIQHLTGDYRCSGYYPGVGDWMAENRDRFLDDTKWVEIDDDNKILYSHAGVSRVWMTNHAVKSIHDINGMTSLFAFEFDNSGLDWYGDDPVQSPVWIRPQSLDECGVDGYTHIVGHTPPRKLIDVWEYTRTEYPDSPHMFSKHHIWLCDTLPREYLVLEDGIFTPKSLPVS